MAEVRTTRDVERLLAATAALYDPTPEDRKKFTADVLTRLGLDDPRPKVDQPAEELTDG